MRSYIVFASRETVNHGRKEYARGRVHTNTAEGWFSLLKCRVMGAFHHISEKYLDRYLDEFVFRYDSRKMTDGESHSTSPNRHCRQALDVQAAH